MRALVVAMIAFASHFAFAQPVEPTPPNPTDGCFPECRAGFTCRSKTCVPDSATLPPEPTPERSGVLWGPESNAPGTGTQPLSANSVPAPPPPKAPPRFELGIGFGLDALFFASKEYVNGSPEVAALEDGFHLDHLNTSLTLDLKIREGKAPMFFSARVGWALVHGFHKASFNPDSWAGVMAVAQQVFRFPLSRDDATLLDRTLSIDLAVGGFFASQGTLGGMANATLNVYWFGIGPQVAFGTETGLDLGLRISSRVAF
jgi:hypothetical protein